MNTLKKQPEVPASLGSVTSYVVGFILAVALTLIAYLAVTNHWATGGTLFALIMGLAAVQLGVQLVFFLHLGREKQSHWNVVAFLFMLMVLVIIVGGSLWIMDNLSYNMQMTPEQMNAYMKEQSSKGF